MHLKRRIFYNILFGRGVNKNCIVDYSSRENIFSSIMVQNFGLKTENYPHSYKLDKKEF